MSRLFKVPYTGTLTAAGGDSDLLSVQPADDKPCYLVGMRLCQSSEVGDTAEENIRITVRHMAATVTIGSGGSAVTPVPSPRPSGTAAGFTARCNDTTVSTTSGTSTIVEEIGWNERNTPLELWWPEPQMQVGAIQTEVFIVRNESTLADDMTIEVTFFIREEGD